ncbi:MAG: phosphatase PAP2 family protein [Candidatus Deferrimicrobium sp.]
MLISVGLVVVVGLPATGYTGGWSVIDHRIHQDESGIWNPNVYRGLMGVLSVAEIGGALWEGSESRLGKTLWQTMDSQLLAVSSATVMKYAFTRERPSETSNPNNWFAHGSNESFPSGEAAFSASMVTPFILEYAGEHPTAYGLLLLPLYVGIGRVKNQAHWQSDVIIGWAIGGLSGWYAHSRETPLLVQVLPDGVIVGLKTRF